MSPKDEDGLWTLEKILLLKPPEGTISADILIFNSQRAILDFSPPSWIFHLNHKKKTKSEN